MTKDKRTAQEQLMDALTEMSKMKGMGPIVLMGVHKHKGEHSLWYMHNGVEDKTFIRLVVGVLQQHLDGEINQVLMRNTETGETTDVTGRLHKAKETKN